MREIGCGDQTGLTDLDVAFRVSGVENLVLMQGEIIIELCEMVVRDYLLPLKQQ